MDGQDPISRWRFTLDGTYYLMREVAEELGTTRHAILARCARHPHLVPAQIGRYANKDVWLFTPEETEALRLDFERVPSRPGRPRVWSEQEAADRQRRRVTRDYWAKKAELARLYNRPARAATAQARVDQISLTLRTQLPTGQE